MRIRSMMNPVAACSPLSRGRTRALIAAKVGSGALSTFGLLRSCFSRCEFTLRRLGCRRPVLRAAPRLRLAALEVFPQRRPQPRLPRRLGPGLGALGHRAEIRAKPAFTG